MSESAGLEIEFKFRVDGEADLDAIARAARTSVAPPVVQVNHFFDTPTGGLREQGWALRLREEGERRILTAKGPKRAAGGDATLTSRPEAECDVPHEQAAQVLAGSLDPLELARKLLAERPEVVDALIRACASDSVRHVGTFRNQRRRAGPFELVAGPPPVEVTLELDRTEFPLGVVHCEVEAEVDGPDAEAAGAALRELLQRAGVRGRPSASKAARFFRLLAGEAVE